MEFLGDVFDFRCDMDEIVRTAAELTILFVCAVDFSDSLDRRVWLEKHHTCFEYLYSDDYWNV